MTRQKERHEFAPHWTHHRVPGVGTVERQEQTLRLHAHVGPEPYPANHDDLWCRPWRIRSKPPPQALAAYVRAVEATARLHGSDPGRLWRITAPGRGMQSRRGGVRISLVHGLHDHPPAPVRRSVARLPDHPRSPFSVASFATVAAPRQQANFARLAQQDAIRFLFFDESLRRVLASGASPSGGFSASPPTGLTLTRPRPTCGT